MKGRGKLIEEIIDLTVRGNVRIAPLLRKCRILSEDFDSIIFTEWIQKELNGYEDWKSLPPYRMANVGSKGFFLGPFGSQINDQPIASGVMKEEHRHLAEIAYFCEPASAYENLREDGDGGYRVEWSGDLVVRYQSSFFKGYALNRAWQNIPAHVLRSIPDVVINRILEFALSMRREFGDEMSAPREKINEYIDSAVINILTA